MSVIAYRIVQHHLAESAFDGEGARQYGGRWNFPGTPIVYLASSISLAALEILVNVEDTSILFKKYVIVPIEFENKLISKIGELPENWLMSRHATATIGSKWCAEGKTLLAEVPSAVIPQEKNYLLNPAHKSFGTVKIRPPIPFRFDERLIK